MQDNITADNETGIPQISVRKTSTPRNQTLPGNTSYLNKEALAACRFGNFNRLLQTLEHGATLDCVDGNKNTLMHCAIMGQQINMVSYLLQKDFNFDVRNNFNETPFFLALKVRRPEIAERLLNHNYLPEVVDNVSGSSSLLLACGCKEQAGGVGLVQRLVGTVGKDLINRANNAGLTPLCVATKNQNLEVMRILLDNGADPNAHNSQDGTTLLHHACLLPKGKDMAEMLIEKHADVNAMDFGGFTPLHMAAKAGKQDVVEYLHSAGANLSAKGWNGSTCLHFAAWEGHSAIVTDLLDRGMDLNDATYFGLTPLHMAVLANKAPVFTLLLDRGAQVDLRAHSLQGRTALHLACIKGMEEAVDVLVKAEANAMAVDSYHNTPYALTIKHRRKAVQQLLESQLEQDALAEAQTEAEKEAVFLGRALRYCEAVKNSQRDPSTAAPSIAKIRFVKFEMLLQKKRFPTFEECREEKWHVPASEMSPNSSVLFISLGCSSHPSAPVAEIDLIAYFLSTVADQADIELIWVAQSCLPQKTSGQIFRDYKETVPAAMLLCSHFLMIPEVVKENNIVTPTSGRKVAPVHTALTDLASFVKQPQCYFDAMAGSITGSEMFCAFQDGVEYSIRALDMFGGTTSGLGIHDAMAKEYRQRMKNTFRKDRDSFSRRLNELWVDMHENSEIMPRLCEAVREQSRRGRGFMTSKFDSTHHAYQRKELKTVREKIFKLDQNADCDGLMGHQLSLLEFCLYVDGTPLTEEDRYKLKSAFEEGLKHQKSEEHFSQSRSPSPTARVSVVDCEKNVQNQSDCEKDKPSILSKQARENVVRVTDNTVIKGSPVCVCNGCSIM